MNIFLIVGSFWIILQLIGNRAMLYKDKSDKGTAHGGAIFVGFLLEAAFVVFMMSKAIS